MMSETIDFTKYRKGSKPNGRPIDYCPRCGSKGEKTTYRDGGQLFSHKAKVKTLYGTGAYLEITESCTVRTEGQR